MRRDVEPGPPSLRTDARVGRSVIAVIGIDHYAEWPRLENAVSDAAGVSRLFRRLGFEEITAPLLDTAATGEAMRRLVTDDLAQLSSDDSLVLFFAGHGHTHTARFSDLSVKTGCVLPVDAVCPTGHVSSSWLRLDTWLSDIARLPPRHILVIIDACRSGVALSALHRWRDEGTEPAELAALQARRSRRIITSALDDQCAMDDGPYPGHSLFTGCLIEALSGGLTESGRRVATGREIGQYLQKRVGSYPPSTQTPDFGTFELDDRGDIVVPILFAEACSGSAARMLEASSEQVATPSPRLSQIDRRITVALTVALMASLGISVTLLGTCNDGNRSPGMHDAGSGGSLPPTVAPAGSAMAARPSAPDTATASQRSTLTDPVDAAIPDPARSIPPVTGRHEHKKASPEQRSPDVSPTQAPMNESWDRPPSQSVPAPVECNTEAVAAAVAAESMTPETFSAAMGNLKACCDAGAIPRTECERDRAALVAK